MNLIRRNLLLLLCLASLVISGCATSSAPSDDTTPAVPADLEQNLAARLDEMGYSGKTPIDRINDARFSNWALVDEWHITATFGASKDYLIRFRSICQNIEFARTVSFDARFASVSRGDRVLLHPRGMAPCFVGSVYELEKKPKQDKE